MRDLPCGNVDPEGITGTPAIDPATGTVYFDALTKTAQGPRQIIYGVSASTGKIAPGWPLDVQSALAVQGITFDSTTQGERSAVLLSNGNLYVDYAGRWGDCGTYHGVVVQLQVSTHTITGYWATRARGGGIWAQGGAASDGNDLFVTTGNTFNASAWSDGEAIVRLKPGLARSEAASDYFTPANWQDLDEDDADLGGTEALPLQVNNAPRLIAMGKDGKAYLVDRDVLGGKGGQIATAKVSRRGIITAPAISSVRPGTRHKNVANQCDRREAWRATAPGRRSPWRRPRQQARPPTGWHRRGALPRRPPAPGAPRW